MTLTVLETCVKNCGKNFHVLVASKEFIQELVKLIGPKYDPPTAVQEKVLSLIQIWAETFAGHPELKGVVEVFQELKNKGIEFPAVDPENSVPIYTPQKVCYGFFYFHMVAKIINFIECSNTATTSSSCASRCSASTGSS